MSCYYLLFYFHMLLSVLNANTRLSFIVGRHAGSRTGLASGTADKVLRPCGDQKLCFCVFLCLRLTCFFDLGLPVPSEILFDLGLCAGSNNHLDSGSACMPVRWICSLRKRGRHLLGFFPAVGHMGVLFAGVLISNRLAHLDGFSWYRKGLDSHAGSSSVLEKCISCNSHPS